MTPEAWADVTAVFPDPMLVLSTDGVVQAANAAARRILGTAPALVGRPLAEAVADDPAHVTRLLDRWARTATLTMGALTLRGADGTLVPCRADGARMQPRPPGAVPAILLWCRPKGQEATTSRFLALNERIAALAREITERQRIETELREQREWLRVTLASIADAVVATDRDGRVTFMNGAAQQMTGWPEGEAVGKPVDEVIRLVDEQSHEPTENPIARVLRDGRVVGLANHTVLVDRAGGEHPIDDSAAPIAAAPGGPVSGVVMVFHDVSERQRLEAEIARRLGELAEADQRKDEFLAMLGHELRNPLAAMANAVALRRRLSPDDPMVERAGQVVDRQLQVMERLVDDLLDVARIRRGAIQLHREPLDLRVVVERALEAARPVLVARGLTAALSQPDQPVEVDADQVRMEQVVANLLSNAVKYTPPGGRVEVTTAAEGDEAVVTVRDTGVGIAPALLAGIFELFVQGRRLLHRPEGGLGLGLTLVRTLVEMHGGRVEAASGGAGQGSTFHVRLPRVTPAGLPESPGERAARPSRGRRVLVVDDHEDSADMLAALLRHEGHEVEVAHDGPAALAAAIRFRPGCVLLDIGLPGMDGYAVAAALRAMRDLGPYTLVALTGYGQAADRERTREAGFDRHIVKPIDPEVLRAVVAESA